MTDIPNSFVSIKKVRHLKKSMLQTTPLRQSLPLHYLFAHGLCRSKWHLPIRRETMLELPYFCTSSIHLGTERKDDFLVMS